MDRVDPLGSWFNLGDRKIDELPGLEDSRATLPRSVESVMMQPRQGQLILKKISATGFIPALNSVATPGSWQISSLGFLFFPDAGAHTLSFSAPLDDIPHGSTIIQVDLVARRKDNTSAIFADIFSSAVVLGTSTGSSSNYAHIDSTSVGNNWTKDTAFPNAIVDQVNRTSGVQVTLQAPNTYVNGDLEFVWLAISYTVPG